MPHEQTLNHLQNQIIKSKKNIIILWSCCLLITAFPETLMSFSSLIVYHQPWKNGQTCSQQDNPGIVCAQDKPVMQNVFELMVKKLLQFSSWKIQCRHSTWYFCLQWVSSKKNFKKRSNHLTQRSIETKRNYFPQMWVTCRFDTTSINNVIISYDITEFDEGR